MHVLTVGLWGEGNIWRLCGAEEDRQVCLGSDKSSGGAHGVLRTEVDIILLLPVDPVCSRALPVEIKIKACYKAEKNIPMQESMLQNVCLSDTAAHRCRINLTQFCQLI